MGSLVAVAAAPVKEHPMFARRAGISNWSRESSLSYSSAVRRRDYRK